MIISGISTVGSNARSENVLSGSSFEFVEQASLVQVAAIVLQPDYEDIQMLMNIGGVNFAEPSFAVIHPLRDWGTQAEGYQVNADGIPNNLYHNYIYAGANPGDRLFLEWVNQGSTADIKVAWIVRIDPV